MRHSQRSFRHVFTALFFFVASITQAGVEEAELKERFGEQQFAPAGGFILQPGQQLPDLVWEQPQQVSRLVAQPAIPTRWFNARFEEVRTAREPGRYYVYGEAPVPAGPLLRRAMTCCCVGNAVSLEELAQKRLLSQRLTTDTSLKPDDVTTLVRHWQNSAEGAVELAALLETDFNPGPVRRGQWQMENATQHVRLKRKLMGLDHKPIVKVTPRSLQGEPAPVLRNASLVEAEITAAQLKQIESKLDAWYAASSEPMAVVIARNGVIVTAKGYGSVDGQAVTVDTPMKLDSAMKPLIGLQLATYIDRGFLRLDQPIGEILPDFDTPRDRSLTFRAAHVHATGIHFPWALAFERLFYFHTWHEALIAHCKREWEPGARYRYGVVGVILSVRALELLRGRELLGCDGTDLFQPLGIKNVLPGGTGFSAENLARIGVLLDNCGRYGTWEFFSRETHAAILPMSLKPYLPELNMQYGIGCRTNLNTWVPAATDTAAAAAHCWSSTRNSISSSDGPQRTGK